MPLKVITRPGTRILWLSGTVSGQRIRESAGTDDPNLAEQKRVAREAEIFRNSILGVKASRQFGEAALSYLKRTRSEDTKKKLNRFLQFLAQTSRQRIACDQVDQDLIDKACDKLLRPGASGSTRLREVLTPVKAVLRHAAIRGWCTVPVFETIRQGKKRKEWLSPAEAERIIAASPRHLADMFVFIFCTGARRGEAINLDWQICPVELQARHAA